MWVFSGSQKMVRRKPTLWAPHNPLPLAGPIVPTEENARQPSCTWSAFTAKFPGFGTGIKLPRNWACEKITEIYSVSRENGSLPIREFSFLFLWGEICNFKDHWTRMEKICDKRYRIYKRFQTQYVGQWPVHFEPPHTTSYFHREVHMPIYFISSQTLANLWLCQQCHFN